MGSVPSVQTSDPVQGLGIYRWATARSVHAGLNDVPAAGMGEEGCGLGRPQGPGGELARLLMRNSKHSGQLERCLVCACLRVYILASLHWSFRGSEQLTFLSLLTRRLERTCSISGLESMWGADVFMLNSIFESSLLLSNMSNYQGELHTLTHAFTFVWLFLVS